MKINCTRALAEAFLFLCIFGQWMPHTTAFDQDVGDVKNLVELPKYVSDVKESLDDHKPVPPLLRPIGE